MKVVGEKSVSSIIKISLIVIFIFGSLVVAFLPLVVKQYILMLRLDLRDLYIPCLVILYASGIPALVIIHQFIKLFGALKNNKPFERTNVRYLKIASITSIIIAVEYIPAMFIFRSLFTLIITGIFFIAWLGLYVLSELFKQAIEYKEENELTI